MQTTVMGRAESSYEYCKVFLGSYECVDRTRMAAYTKPVPVNPMRKGWAPLSWFVTVNYNCYY